MERRIMSARKSSSVVTTSTSTTTTEEPLSTGGDQNLIVVMDNGSGYTKVGFAGDDVPSLVFPTLIGQKRNSNSRSEWYDSVAYGNQALQFDKVVRPIPSSERVDISWDLEHLWHHTFYDLLKIVPEETRLFLPEPHLSPLKDRERKAEMAFETFTIPSLLVWPQGPLALFSSAMASGLCVEMGYGFTQIVPIVDGNYFPRATFKCCNAGKSINKRLEDLIHQRPSSFLTKGSAITEQWAHAYEGIKERVCYVASDPDLEARKSLGQPNQLVTLPDGAKFHIYSENHRATEALFYPELIGMGADLSIQALCWKSIVNSQQDLANNIALSGGSSMFTGLATRLQKEISHISSSTVNVRVLSNEGRQHAVWLGGSILGSLPGHFDNWKLSKAEYSERGCQSLNNNWNLLTVHESEPELSNEFNGKLVESPTLTQTHRTQVQEDPPRQKVVLKKSTTTKTRKNPVPQKNRVSSTTTRGATGKGTQVESAQMDEVVEIKRQLLLTTGKNLQAEICHFEKGRMGLVELESLETSTAVTIGKGCNGSVHKVDLRSAAIRSSTQPTTVALKMMFNFSAGERTKHQKDWFDRECEVGFMHPHWCLANIYNYFRGDTQLNLVPSELRPKYALVDDARRWVEGSTDYDAIPIFKRTTFLTIELGQCTLDSRLSDKFGRFPRKPLPLDGGNPLSGAHTQIGLLQLAFCLLCACYNLNSHGWFHCDIKIDNVLLMNRPNVSGSSWVLCDMGTSIRCPDGEDFILLNEGECMDGNQSNRAPELFHSVPQPKISGQIYSQRKYQLGKNDVWAVGCVLFEAICGQHPYARANQPIDIEFISSTTKPPFVVPPQFQSSSWASALIPHLLERENFRRPSAKQAMLICGAIMFFPHPHCDWLCAPSSMEEAINFFSGTTKAIEAILFDIHSANVSALSKTVNTASTTTKTTTKSSAALPTVEQVCSLVFTNEALADVASFQATMLEFCEQREVYSADIISARHPAKTKEILPSIIDEVAVGDRPVLTSTTKSHAKPAKGRYPPTTQRKEITFGE
ncbi:actin beta/gamma 1 [Pelomyxa schiedti]|nr:actin beta/gamma 1 [Pelomyxa schiedti]